jgi:AcrR family transcriptional regulator
MSTNNTRQTATRRSAKGPRRTQEERSAATRQKLLDAAIECLVELGYARMTTTDVADRAGVSRGAQLHHFPSKVELVTSAIRHLADRRLAELRREAASLPAGKRGIPQMTELTWSYSSNSLYMAALDLVIASRTDPELHAALWPVEKEFARASSQLLRELYADYVEHPDFEMMMHLTVHMMRGMALQKILKNDDRHRNKALKLWEQLMTAVLEDGRGTGKED